MACLGARAGEVLYTPLTEVAGVMDSVVMVRSFSKP
jgi:hypothetical protein